MSEQKRREDINTHRMHRNSHDFRLLRLSVTFCSEHPQTNRSRGRRGGQQIHHFTEDHCSFVSSIRTVLSGYSLTSLPFPFLSFPASDSIVSWSITGSILDTLIPLSRCWNFKTRGAPPKVRTHLPSRQHPAPLAL